MKYDNMDQEGKHNIEENTLTTEIETSQQTTGGFDSFMIIFLFSLQVNPWIYFWMSNSTSKYYIYYSPFSKILG